MYEFLHQPSHEECITMTERSPSTLFRHYTDLYYNNYERVISELFSGSELWRDRSSPVLRATGCFAQLFMCFSDLLQRLSTTTDITSLTRTGRASSLRWTPSWLAECTSLPGGSRNRTTTTGRTNGGLKGEGSSGTSSTSSMDSSGTSSMDSGGVEGGKGARPSGGPWLSGG